MSTTELLIQKRQALGITPALVARFAKVTPPAEKRAAPRLNYSKQKALARYKAAGLTCLGEPRVNIMRKLGVRRDDPRYRQLYHQLVVKPKRAAKVKP